MNTYTDWQQADKVEWPTYRPFTYEVMGKSGKTQEHTFPDRPDHPLLSSNTIAVRIAQPDELALLIASTLKAVGLRPADYNSKYVEAAVRHLHEKGELVATHQQSKKANWLEKRMDKLGYQNLLTLRENIRTWAENPQRNPVLPYDINNQILVVMPSPSGYGRVVVCPTGHTLAYSTAQQIYDYISGKYDYMLLPDRVSCGEHIRGSNWRHSKFRLTVESKKGVTIGCQFIPIDAINNLAEREGW